MILFDYRQRLIVQPLPNVKGDSARDKLFLPADKGARFVEDDENDRGVLNEFGFILLLLLGLNGPEVVVYEGEDRGD